MRTRMSVLGSLSIIIILSLWLKSGDKAPELPNIEFPETPSAPDLGDYTLARGDGHGLGKEIASFG